MREDRKAVGLAKWLARSPGEKRRATAPGFGELTAH